MEFDITTQEGIRRASEHFGVSLANKPGTIDEDDFVKNPGKALFYAAMLAIGAILIMNKGDSEEREREKAGESQLNLTKKILELSDKAGYREVSVRVNSGYKINTDVIKIDGFPVKVTETGAGRLRIHADLD